MQVPKMKIQRELDIYFRKAQADALRWAAYLVNENITRDRDGKGNHYTAEETRDMIRHMADCIERVKKEA